MHTKLIFFALLLSTCSVLSAQQKTHRYIRLTGGFGAPIYTYTHAPNTSGHGAGGGGGLVFNDLFIGGFGMGEAFDAPGTDYLQPSIGYGGLWLGYSIQSRRLFHGYTSLKIAGGAVNAKEHDFDDPDAVFVAIPEAGIEWNVARWFRLSASIGYRFINGFEGLGTLDKNDLNAPVYALTLRFGWFEPK